MARTAGDRIDRTEDALVAQALTLQSHQSTIDQVLVPLVDRVKDLEEQLESVQSDLDRARGSFRTLVAIGAVLVALATLIIAYLQLGAT